MPSKKKTTTNFFPAKLHSLLEHAETRGYANIISWQEGGNSFKVWNPDFFVATIMPKYFKQTKLKSFQRQLNIYGWKRIGTGKNRGGYFHPSFLQGMPERCLLLKRTPLPDSKGSISSSKDDYDDHSSAAAPDPQIRLVENLPTNTSMNTNNNSGMYGNIEQLLNSHSRNPLMGNTMNSSNQVPRASFHMAKTSLEAQSSSGMMMMMMDPFMDPFGVRGLSAFGHSSRNTVPRTMVGGKGKLSEDMHLFADLFNPRDFQEDFRDDLRHRSNDFSSNIKAQQQTMMTLMMMNNNNNNHGSNMHQVAPCDPLTLEDNVSSRQAVSHKEQQQQQTPAGGDSSVETPGACENVFPQKLHFLLNQAEKEGFDHIISWVNDGAAFKVHDSRAFLEKVMPSYFDQSKFESFRRQLNLYGFQRVSRGPSRGIYYHQFFLKSEPSLCQSITRPSTTTTTTAPSRALIKC